jgi:hypothetical protein
VRDWAKFRAFPHTTSAFYTERNRFNLIKLQNIKIFCLFMLLLFKFFSCKTS